MKQPEHLAGPAFKEAADKIAFLENQLSDEQKPQYAHFVERQEKEKEEQNRKAAQKKAEYDQAKEKHPRAILNYDPPSRIRDPYLRQFAREAQAEHQKTTTLTHTQQEARLRFLEKLEQQRATLTKEAGQQRAEQQQEKLSQFRDNAQQMTRSRASPEFNRAATPEQQPKVREESARAATAGKAKTDFEKAAKPGPAKDSALARAFAKANEREKEQNRERVRTDESKGRARSD